MLKLTKRTEYGLIALVHLADQAAAAPEGAEVEVVSSRAISDRFPVPKRLLAEALKALQTSGIVDSTRGAHGGYRLSRAAESINLGEIVTALEGAPTLTPCADLEASADDDHSCEIEGICPIKSPLHRVQMNIWSLMEGVSLADLANRSIDPSIISAAS